MNVSMNSNHSNIPNEQEWRQIDQLIQSISEDQELDEPESPVDLMIDYPQGEKDRAIFDAVLKKFSRRYSFRMSSMVERWAIQQSQVNWLAVLQKRLDDIRRSHRQAWGEMQAFFGLLGDTIEVMTQRMTPALAHRGAAAVKEHIYQPRRRALEPADLPAFPALFCTAVDPTAKPFLISGLTPNELHRFTLIRLQDPSVKQETPLSADDKGQVEIDLAASLVALQKQNDVFHEYVWFLREEKEGGAWTSGLVWLESNATRKLAADAVRVLMENEDKNSADARIDALFEINLLATREYYMKAYEEARQGLLFLPRQYREENSAPFKESLWLLINHLMDKIIAKMEKAKPVILEIQPTWNALE
ncbi:MAG: hypothetical protein ACP5I1_20775, partial [Candidatus Hinthialibacter sp.]